jgi:hypothetical protein
MTDEVATPARRSTDLPPDAPWWARWLVANADQAWKWASVWWPVSCAAVAEVYAQYPAEITDFVRGLLPASWWPHVLSGAFLAGAVFRIIKFKTRTPAL